MKHEGHVHARSGCEYREFRVRMWETRSSYTVLLEVKPLNACYCAFETVMRKTFSTAGEGVSFATLEDACSYLGEFLLGDCLLP